MLKAIRLRMTDQKAWTFKGHIVKYMYTQYNLKVLSVEEVYMSYIFIFNYIRRNNPPTVSSSLGCSLALLLRVSNLRTHWHDSVKKCVEK